METFFIVELLGAENADTTTHKDMVVVGAGELPHVSANDRENIRMIERRIRSHFDKIEAIRIARVEVKERRVTQKKTGITKLIRETVSKTIRPFNNREQRTWLAHSNESLV